MSTIAAISTPQAAGGLAVIRLSGERALEIAAEIFAPFGRKTVAEMPGHSCAYGKIVLGGEPVDDVLLTVFRAPKSFTGEDTAEISCHGGLYVSRRILRGLIALGCESAGPGEFTKRAFLNGKLSLTQAEAVADIISAEGENALASANQMRDGALYRRIRGVSDRLLELLSALAAWTDYPDEDVPEVGSEELGAALSECEKKLNEITDSYDAGLIFREGIACAIAGRPNVGKSTLMNALLGYERSIVTDRAGTTRDVVEEKLRLGDVILRISDTAGMRDAEDEVEKIGVQLADRAIERAQLVLAVFDGSEELTEDDFRVLERLKNRRHIIVVNKSDLPKKLDISAFAGSINVETDAKTGAGVERLKDAVYEMFSLDSHSGSAEIFANERQKNCCDRAVARLREAEAALAAGETLDAVTVCIDAAADALLELTGEKVTEAVVDEVFKRFCVGK